MKTFAQYLRLLENFQQITLGQTKTSDEILQYLMDEMQDEKHSIDWISHVQKHHHFVLKDIPLNDVKYEDFFKKNNLPPLDDTEEKEKVEGLDLTKPIVVDSEGYIIDGYHRVKACKTPTIRAWVGVLKETNN